MGVPTHLRGFVMVHMLVLHCILGKGRKQGRTSSVGLLPIKRRRSFLQISREKTSCNYSDFFTLSLQILHTQKWLKWKKSKLRKYVIFNVISMYGATTVRMTIGIHERRRIKPSVKRWRWPLVNEFRLYWNHVKYNTISCFQLKSVCYLWQRHRQQCSWAGVILRKQTKNTCPQPFSKSAESHIGWFIAEPKGPGPSRVF